MPDTLATGRQSETVHLFVTDEAPYGYTLASPQMPGLAFGRPTWTEFTRDAPQLLDLLLEDDSRPRLMHEEILGVGSHDDEYAIRYADDKHLDERLVVAGALRGLFDKGVSFGALDPNQLGVHQFICARREDRMAWLSEQLFNDVEIVHFAVIDHDRVVTRSTLGPGAVGVTIDGVQGPDRTLGEFIDEAPSISMELPDDARELTDLRRHLPGLVVY